MYLKIHLKNILIILWIIVLLSYTIRPSYSPIINWNAFYFDVFIFFLSTFLYYRINNRSNYFDFDTLFIILFFFVGYFATFFANSEIYPYLFLHFTFDEGYINSGATLFTIGILSYYLGRLSFYKGLRQDISNHLACNSISTNTLTTILSLLIVSYLLMGGLNYYKNIYLDNAYTYNGITIQIGILIQVISIVIISTELYNYKINPKYKIKLWKIILIFLYCLLLLFVGNRTIPSFLVLAFLGLYTFYFKRIKLFYMLTFIAIAFIAMYVFSLLRSDYEISLVSNAAIFTKDMTVNTRNTYVAMEYVSKNGLTYGKTMLSEPLGIIPFLSSILQYNNTELSSASFLTDYSYTYIISNREFIGLGTNIIADIYLSFGGIGVIVLMYLLGKFVTWAMFGAQNLHYYSTIVFTIILSYGAYWIRTGLLHPARTIVWALLIAYLNKKLTK